MPRSKFRWFAHDVTVRPPAGREVNGMFVQFTRTRSWIKWIRAKVDGDAVPVHVNGRTRQRTFVGRRSDGDIEFELEFAQPLQLADGAVVRLEGPYRGVYPQGMRVAWLAHGGEVINEDAPPQVEDGGIPDTVFDPGEVGKLKLILGESYREIMGRRLRGVAELQSPEPHVLRGATFFYDLDQTTHSDGMTEDRQLALEKMRDWLFLRAKQRAKGLQLAPLPDRREQLDEIYRQFRRLVRTHFGDSTRSSDYDSACFGAAIRAFLLAELPRVGIHGTPDSTFYLCFAELLLAFGELAPDQERRAVREYWLPALEAFVLNGFAFPLAYHRGGARDSSRYSGHLVANLAGTADLKEAVVTEIETRWLQYSQSTSGRDQDECWDLVAELSAELVRITLRDELDD